MTTRRSVIPQGAASLLLLISDIILMVRRQDWILGAFTVTVVAGWFAWCIALLLLTHGDAGPS